MVGFLSDNAFKMTPGGVVNQIIDATGDGTNSLSAPIDVKMDGNDNVYVSGFGSNNVFKITLGGVITQIIDASGDGANAFITGGNVAVDGNDNVYVTGRDSHNAFKITPGGVITQIIDSTGDSVNPLSAPIGIDADGAGNVYVSGNSSDNAFKVTPGGVITQIIDATGDGLGNTLDNPTCTATDASGNEATADFTVTVQDTTLPTLLTVAPTEDTVVLTFSEPLDPATATAVLNYSISPGITVLSALLNIDTVTLTTSSHSEGVVYNLTAQNVEDPEGNPMTTANFGYSVVLTDPNLTLHLEFNEGADLTAADSSGNGNDGTLVNGVQWDTGQIDGAVHLDGVNDVVSVNPAPMQMNTWNAITVTAWVQNDVGAVGQTHDIASWWNFPTARSWVLTHHKNNQYFFEIAGQGNVSGGSVSTDWAHVVGTYDGTTMRLYVDGQEVASQGVPGGTLSSSTAALLLGGQADGTNHFEGVVDDMKIYDRALDGLEVQTLFQDESP